MPKQFYTEKDIDDLFQSGVKSLQVTDQVVLTELAYEKARRLGLQLVTDRPDTPPAAPVRPYLSDESTSPTKPATNSVSQAAFQSKPAAPDTNAIEQRIRSAVIAKLGNQVDAKLLDTIIHRVVQNTGLK
jgi:hypothetical protein